MKRASEETAIDQHHDRSLPFGSASKKFKPSSSGLDGNALAEDGIQVEKEDDLSRFQKKAIYLQMCEYKRLYLSGQDRHSVEKLQLAETRDVLGRVLGIWGLVESSLSCTNSNLHKTLPNAELSIKLDSAWSSVKQALASGSKGVQIDTEGSLLKVKELERSLAQKIAENTSLGEELENIRAILQSTLKKVDRLRILKTPPPAAADSSSAPAIKTEDDATNKKSEGSSGVNEDQFFEVRALAETRLSQIELLTKEKYTLQRELEDRLQDLSYERAGREVEKTLRHQLSLQDSLKHDLENALIEIETLKAGRGAFTEQIINEEEKRRKAAEVDIKKCEQDLIRLRTHRDNLQKSLDLKAAVETRPGNLQQVVDQITKLCDARMERIQTLEMQVKRLLIDGAAQAGEAGLLKFFQEEDAGQHGSYNPYKSAVAQIEALKAKAAELEEIVACFETKDQVKLALDLKQSVDKCHALERELTRYKDSFGDISEDGEGMVDLALEVGRREEELKAFKIKHEGLEMTEKMLKDEFEALGAAWVKLEEQVADKVFNLSQREDQISKLVGEKSRLEQKVIALTKQITTATNNQIAQKRQSEKLLEQIRKLEEIEKSLSLQLQASDRKIASISPSLLRVEQKLEAQVLENSQIKDQAKSLFAKCETISALLNEKSEQMEIEKELARKTMEQMATLKKKYDSFVKDNGDAIQRQQLDQYRLLLMCQSCNNDFKSHVLLKCMHTFCKACIDDRLDSRQRKCPTCAIPFGQQDVKQVYL